MRCMQTFDWWCTLVTERQQVVDVRLQTCMLLQFRTNTLTWGHWRLFVFYFYSFQMARCECVQPHVYQVLGGVPAGHPGGCVARWSFANCPGVWTQPAAKGWHQTTSFTLSDETLTRYISRSLWPWIGVIPVAVFALIQSVWVVSTSQSFFCV